MTEQPSQKPRRDSAPAAALPWRPLLYPAMYAAFIVLAALDIALTWTILGLGGHELNVVADWVIRTFDKLGVVAYKFTLVALVIVICEAVGRRNHVTGLRLARWAVALTAVPVVVGLVHVLSTFAGPGPAP